MFTPDNAKECLFAVKECITLASQAQVLTSLLSLGYTVSLDSHPDAVALANSLHKLKTDWVPPKSRGALSGRVRH